MRQVAKSHCLLILCCYRNSLELIRNQCVSTLFRGRMFIVFINASCFLIEVAMPKLVYIRVSSVGSVNLCAKSPEKESSYIRKEENYANFRTQFFQ